MTSNSSPSWSFRRLDEPAQRCKDLPSVGQLPQAGRVGRTLPKNKIYEHSSANTRLKDMFVEQVEQIVWRYKLAPETTNLPAKPDVPEIQIFAIQLKTPELHHDVLRCIDGARCSSPSSLNGSRPTGRCQDTSDCAQTPQ